MHNGTRRTLAALAFIGLALALMTYEQVKQFTFYNKHNSIAFLFHADNRYIPPLKTEFGTMDLYRNWKPRLLSNIAGGWFTRDALVNGDVDYNDLSWRVGAYAALWLLAICALYLVALREEALLPILGTYCGVAFGYMPNLADRVYPWDMPALFIYTLFLCLVIRRRLVWLLPLLPVAVLFKETAGLLPVAFLFEPGRWRRRAGLFAIGMALAAATRLWVTWQTDTQGGGLVNLTLLKLNLGYLFTVDFPYAREWYRIDHLFFNHPVFVNAGFLTAFFIAARGRDPHVPMLRTIALLFIAGTLLCGVIFEYRIWFELIPIGIYPFYARRVAGRMMDGMDEMDKIDGNQGFS